MDSSSLKQKADSVRDEDPAEAARLYAEASDLGDAAASSSLGYMYMVGEGVPADPVKAETYLERAAEGGDVRGMCNLGSLLSSTDPARALVLFEKAGELGSIAGMRNAASMIRNSLVPSDPERAVGWLERASELGDTDSIALLAHILRTGEGVEADKPRAYSLYLKAAEAGDPDSQYDLAMMLDSGDGIPADRAEAERWFRMSAEHGDNDARLCLGGILYERGDYAEAADLFTDAALDGDVKAMYNLALLIMEGSLGEPDVSKAAEWLESASDKGFAYAQSMLGGMLLDQGDVAGAERRLRQAAEQNEPTAMYNLAALALSGRIKMDDREAVRFLMSAADAGMEEARTLLMELSGRGML